MFKKSKPNFIRVRVEVPNLDYDGQTSLEHFYMVEVEVPEGVTISDALVDKIYEDLAAKVLRG